MPYTPPSGYVERADGSLEHLTRIVEWFHTRTDCPRIKAATALVPVQRPYSAPRCTVCASE